MPRFVISIVNACYAAREGGDYDEAEAALAAGVETAMAIAADEIRAGRANAAIQVSVDDQDGANLHRSVVMLAVATVMSGPIPTYGLLTAPDPDAP